MTSDSKYGTIKLQERLWNFYRKDADNILRLSMCLAWLEFHTISRQIEHDIVISVNMCKFRDLFYWLKLKIKEDIIHKEISKSTRVVVFFLEA